MYTGSDKVCSLTELTRYVENGDRVAIGGGLSNREPMAAIRQLIRQGTKELTLIGSAHGIDVDLLCGAGLVGVTAESYVGFEQDFGMAPNYRRSIESGAVKVEESCCYTLVQQLRAAIAGLPFMHIRSIQGTDFMSLHPEFKTMVCPYTGETLVLVPALKPDIAILHVQFADSQGNLHISGPPVADILFAKASNKVIATAEKIISKDEMKDMGVTIPYFYVTAISEVQFGAHPTSCYPNYVYDRNHTAYYYQQAKLGEDAFNENYLQPFVHQCSDHKSYLDAVEGIQSLQRLKSWNENTAQWMALYE